MSEHLFIAASGMINAVGGDAEMTDAAISTGLNNAQEVSFLNRRYAEIKLSAVPDEALPLLGEVADQDLRTRRMLALSHYALSQLGQQLKLEVPVPLFLAGPETLPSMSAAMDLGFIEQLAEVSGLPIDLKQSRVLLTGRAGGLHALDLAAKYLQATGASFCLVGGVDSPFDARLLAHLDSLDRLNVADITDGFIPGEAAAFLLVASPQLATKLSNKSAAWLKTCYPAFGTEPGHRYSEAPYLGEGMSAAVSQALALSQHPAAFSQVLSSLNGESFGAKELGVALTRHHDVLGEALDIAHPADCFGDIGAAFVPTNLAILQFQTATQPLRDKRLFAIASDLESRAALVIEPTT